jgi:1-acyl-sn-glycerol-3-phosphate acyltransferase
MHFVDTATGAMSFAPCYIGDDTLLQSLWRTVTTPNLEAVVSFGVAQTAQGRDRRVWAQDLRQAVIDLRADPSLRV